MESLAKRWRDLLADYAPDERIRDGFAGMARFYGEPGRHYHTFEHIRSVLSWIDALDATAPPALLLAGFLHDVICDPRATDNELRSGRYARDTLTALGVPPAVGAETERLILLTSTHEALATDAAGGVLLDADLAILAAPAADYVAYAAAIRREYAWVAEADYRAGRRQVLERFLARPHIYHTAPMRGDAEEAARANLAREIATLRSHPV